MNVLPVVPVLGWLFTGLLLVLVVACVLAARGVLPPNHLAGVRFPSLLRSPAAWRAGHRAGIVPASVTFVAALVCCLVGLAVPAAYAGAVIVFAVGVVWVVVRATTVARGVAG